MLQKGGAFRGAERRVKLCGIHKVHPEGGKQRTALGKREDLPAVLSVIKRRQPDEQPLTRGDLFRRSDQRPVTDMHAVEIAEQQHARLT